MKNTRAKKKLIPMPLAAYFRIYTYMYIRVASMPLHTQICKKKNK